MEPKDIITIMRHRRWLEDEPRTTRELITSAARYMLVKNGSTTIDLARRMRKVSDSYIRSKMGEHRWTMEDLDELSEIFGRPVCDFVQGYRWMAERDEREKVSLPTPEEPHDE